MSIFDRCEFWTRVNARGWSSNGASTFLGRSFPRDERDSVHSSSTRSCATISAARSIPSTRQRGSAIRCACPSRIGRTRLAPPPCRRPQCREKSATRPSSAPGRGSPSAVCPRPATGRIRRRMLERGSRYTWLLIDASCGRRSSRTGFSRGVARTRLEHTRIRTYARADGAKNGPSRVCCNDR